MAEAKQALQVLFEQATEIKRKAVQNELKLTEAQEITAEVVYLLSRPYHSFHY